MTATIDPCAEATAAETAAVQALLGTLHDRMYSEPAPNPHAVAKCLTDLAGLRVRVEALIDLLG